MNTCFYFPSHYARLSTIFAFCLILHHMSQWQQFFYKWIPAHDIFNNSISSLIILSFNSPKPIRGLDALSVATIKEDSKVPVLTPRVNFKRTPNNTWSIELFHTYTKQYMIWLGSECPCQRYEWHFHTYRSTIDDTYFHRTCWEHHTWRCPYRQQRAQWRVLVDWRQLDEVLMHLRWREGTALMWCCCSTTAVERKVKWHEEQRRFDF